LKQECQTAALSIFRYDPGQGKPFFQAYQVPLTQSMTVLEALFYLSAHGQDPPAFRPYRCNRGQCAACVMTIDGRTRRACTTPVRTGMVIEPLYDYPVIRDLVVDFGTRSQVWDGRFHQARTGRFVLKSRYRRPKALRGPWVFMDVDEEKCLTCEEKPCVGSCPVNRIENLENQDGLRIPPFSGPIRIQNHRAKLAGVCNLCTNWPCMHKCPTQAFRIVAHGAGSRIDPGRCIGCGLCVAACPMGNIWLNLERGYAVKCDLCNGNPECVKACPRDAVKFEIIRRG